MTARSLGQGDAAMTTRSVGQGGVRMTARPGAEDA